MSEIRYQVARKGTGNFGPYLTLNATMADLKNRIDTDQGPFRILRNGGNDPGPLLDTRFETFKRVRNHLEKAEPGYKEAILVDTGRFNFVVRVGEIDPIPSNWFAGDKPVDRLVKKTYEKFNDQYGLVNLGICASKAGQHSLCRAVDIGVSKPTNSDDIHEAILDIGNYHRQGMLRDMQGEPNGLPVNGVIVMYQVCSREGGTYWHSYGGTGHMAHTHTSVWPNLLSGWV